jgi:predicted HAD superfamily Cof-like phosphohydrolase
LTDTIKAVAEFHSAFSLPTRETPAIDDMHLTNRWIFNDGIAALKEALFAFRTAAGRGCGMNLRMALEVEELVELSEAIRDRNLEAALDAQVDRRYIADGTTLRLGLASAFDEAFSRVHAANMAKLGPDGKPILDDTGKVKKPAGWQAPDLGDLIK